MKKQLLFFITALIFITGFSQTINIPDANFEQALIDLNLDNTSPTDDIDGVIETSIAADVINLDVSYKNISDLSGIEGFVSLEWLHVEGNNLTAVDLSNNLSLQRLFIYSNNLTTLDLSNLSLLERLYCQSNQISSLVLPVTNSSLQRLECQFNNLTSLDLSNSVLLDDIKMQHNNFSFIDFSNNALLENIDAFNNQLTSVNLDNCAVIEDIDFRNNQLTELHLEDRLELYKIYLDYNDLNSLTIKNVKSSAWNFYITLLNNPNLTCVAVSNPTESENEWSNVDSQVFFSENCNATAVSIPDANFEQALIDLGIDSDGIINGQILETDALGIIDLDVNSYNISDLTGIEFFIDLEILTAFNNNLSTVDLSQNSQLTTVLLALNNLTEIDLSNQPNLISLSLNDNNLNTIDLSSNSLLTQLFLNQNSLSEIDLSTLTSLESLSISYNAIVELDVSQNLNITTLFCNDNDLVSLVVSNGNNNNFLNFEAQNNTDLYCIQVDDVTYSNNNWLSAEPQFNFDSQVAFGLDCAPNNDDCIEATTLTLGDLISGSTLSATSSLNLPSCQDNTIPLIDVWYQFTAPSSGSITSIANAALNNLNVNMAIYNDCNEVEPINCDSGTVEVNDLVPGQTYYLQLWIGGNLSGRSVQNTDLVGDFTVQVVDSTTLSIEENEMVTEVKLFPNPATSEVNIHTNSVIDNITLFDVSGKQVLVIKAVNANNYNLNLKDFSKGLYFVQIQNQNSTINQKLLIK